MPEDVDRGKLVRFARRARARMALVRGLEWAQRALFYALCAAVAAVLLDRFLAVRLPLPAAAGALGAAVAVSGLLAALFPRIGLLEAAAAADARAGWKERLSSALALPSVSRPMEHALLEDARERLGGASPPELFPLRAPREIKFAPLPALAILASFLFVPSLDLLGTRARQKAKEEEKKEIELAVEKLEGRKKVLEKSKQLSERVKQAVQKIDALAKELVQSPPQDRKDILAQLSSLADELKKLKNELSKSESLAAKLQKSLSKDAGDAGDLGRLLKEGKFAEAAQELAKLRNALQEGKLTPAEKEKLQKQLQALADKLGKNKDLSELEKKLAQAMQGLDQGKEQMLDGLQQALNSLDSEMDEAKALADALKDLEKLADALAKDKHRCPS